LTPENNVEAAALEPAFPVLYTGLAMASSKKRAPAPRKAREDVELGDDLDALFTKPLSEFTKARDDLAKKLKSAGDREGAASVKAMRKPSVSAWTLNQLARRYPQRMDALLEAGEGLREAQRGALEAGGAKALREASQAHRALVNELLRAAPPLMSEAGFQAGGANMDRVRDSLLAAPTARREDLERLERGRLTQDLEPGDLSDVLGLMRGRPAPRPEEEPKTGGRAKAEAPAKEAPAKAEKPKRKAAAKAPMPERKAAEAPRREAKTADQNEKKTLAAEAREEKKRRAEAQREEKKRLAAEAREEKKRRAEAQRDEKKALAQARKEREQASREAARTAKEAKRRTAEAERLFREAEEAEAAAKSARDQARDAEREANEAQKLAEEAARRLEAAERDLER